MVPRTSQIRQYFMCSRWQLQNLLTVSFVRKADKPLLVEETGSLARSCPLLDGVPLAAGFLWGPIGLPPTL